MADSPIPMLLAASGSAAQFCAKPEIWPMFEEWLTEGLDGGLDSSVSRETLHIAAKVILMIVQGMEEEMITESFAELLGRN